VSKPDATAPIDGLAIVLLALAALWLIVQLAQHFLGH
jgi:hypothetical protein